MSIRKDDKALEVLLDLDRKNELTPTNAFHAAEPEDSPLHKYFEWDKDRCFYRHNIEIARKLIASVRIVVKTNPVKRDAPRFVHIPTPERTQGYMDVLRVKTEAEIRRDSLRDELKRWISIGERVESLYAAYEMEAQQAEAADIIARTRALLEQVET